MEDQIEVERRYPREARTPTDEAFYIVASISEYFHRKLPEMPEGAFGRGLLTPALEAVFPAGDRFKEDLKVEFAERPEEAGQMTGMYMMALAVNYAMDGIRAEKAGRLNLAWTMIADAHYWRGLVLSEPGEANKVQAVKENAQKAAKASHADNYAMREEVFSWCKDNLDRFDGNVSAAAREASKLVPMKVRTLQEWIRMYRDLKPAP